VTEIDCTLFNRVQKELHAFNQRVVDARVKREKLILDKEQSMMMTSRAVKDYLGAIFGFNSLEYRQMKGIVIS